MSSENASKCEVGFICKVCDCSFKRLSLLPLSTKSEAPCPSRQGSGYSQPSPTIPNSWGNEVRHHFIMFYAMAFGLRSRGSFRKYSTRPFNPRTPPGVLREWAIIQGSVASGGWWSAASHASGLNWVLKVLCPHVAQPRCTVDPRNIGSAHSSGNPHTLSLLRRPWREWTLRYAIESPHLAFSSHQSSQSVPQNRGI